jgi:hypothetical protein
MVDSDLKRLKKLHLTLGLRINLKWCNMEDSAKTNWNQQRLWIMGVLEVVRLFLLTFHKFSDQIQLEVHHLAKNLGALLWLVQLQKHSTKWLLIQSINSGFH